MKCLLSIFLAVFAFGATLAYEPGKVGEDSRISEIMVFVDGKELKEFAPEELGQMFHDSLKSKFETREELNFILELYKERFNRNFALQGNDFFAMIFYYFDNREKILSDDNLKSFRADLTLTSLLTYSKIKKFIELEYKEGKKSLSHPPLPGGIKDIALYPGISPDAIKDPEKKKEYLILIEEHEKEVGEKQKYNYERHRLIDIRDSMRVNIKMFLYYDYVQLGGATSPEILETIAERLESESDDIKIIIKGLQKVLKNEIKPKEYFSDIDSWG